MPSKVRRTRVPAAGGGGAGLAVDAHGGAVIDPTENVIALSEGQNKRQDDLRALERELFDRDIAHVKELASVRALHQQQLDQKESGRLDSIRQVDREEVTKAALSAQQAIATLAISTSTVAETLRAQQEAKGLAAEARQAAFAGEVGKRLSAVELALSEGKGKQAVADPMMAELVSEMRILTAQRAAESGKQAVTDPLLGQLAADVRALVAAQATTSGKTSGIALSWGVLLGAVALAGALGFFTNFRPAPAPTAAPQVIYVPSPPGTMLPTTPPQPAPR